MDTGTAPPSTPSARDRVRQGWRGLPSAARAAIVLSALGFVVGLTFESTATSNGAVTECSYTDIGAIGFGAAAIVAGAFTLVKATGATRRNLVIAIGVLAMAVGAHHVARGFGVFHDCGPTSNFAAVGGPAIGSFGPDEARDRTEEQLGDNDVQAQADATPHDDPTPLDGSWTAPVVVASIHRNETFRIELPDDWTVTADGSGTPTRQQLPEAVSADGSITIGGHARGLTEEEQNEFHQEAANGDAIPASVGSFDGWTLVDPALTITRHQYVVLIDDLFLKITFQADNETNRDPSDEIESIIATLQLS